MDVLLLSRCDFLLHGASGISELAIYFNPALINHSFGVGWARGQESQWLVRAASQSTSGLLRQASLLSRAGRKRERRAKGFEDASNMSAAQGWLRFNAIWHSMVHGYCEETEVGAGICSVDNKGSFALSTANLQSWNSAVNACTSKCSTCPRCRVISVSVRFADCSWFNVKSTKECKSIGKAGSPKTTDHLTFNVFEAVNKMRRQRRSQHSHTAALRPPPFATWSAGFCGRTDGNVGTHCKPRDTQGSWQSALSSEQCIQQCLECPQCHYISYSPLDSDCSWYAVCPKLRTKLYWVRESTGHRTLQLRDEYGASIFDVRAQKHRTLVLVVGSLRGGEEAWESLFRNLVEPNGDVDVALSVGAPSTDPESMAAFNSSSLRRRARWVWLTDEVKDWGAHLDALGGASTMWRALLTEQLRKSSKRQLGIAGHAAFGGVRLAGCAQCQRRCTLGNRETNMQCQRRCPLCIGGTGVINYVLRWKARRKLEELALASNYTRLVITHADVFYACRLDLGTLTPPRNASSPFSVYIPHGEDWYGLYDRFAVCTGARLLDCLRLVDPVILAPEAHVKLMTLSPEAFYHRRLRQLGAQVVRFPRTMFTVGTIASDGKAESGWGENSVGMTHLPSKLAEPVWGLHVKYSTEYYGALRTCFRDRPLKSLGV